MPSRSRCAQPGRLVGEDAAAGAPSSRAITGPARACSRMYASAAGVDDVVGVAGPQQLEEVQPALAGRRAEPGEAVVADLRADAVDAAVARAGVVHRDPGAVCQPHPQHLPGLGKEVVLPGDQQAHHLTLADADPSGLELGHQPLHRHLALVVLHQHVAPQLRPEVAADAGRQRRHQGLPRSASASARADSAPPGPSAPGPAPGSARSP